MRLKTALTALALTVLPVVSYASCAGHQEQAQSCAEGSTWDSASQSCVKQITG